MLKAEEISAVILAGGMGRRMNNQDKGLIQWQGKPIIEHILSQLTPQCGEILINANRNLDQYARYRLPLVSDEIEGYQGPLVGILSAMKQCNHDYLLCLPCDTPHPPENLVAQLMTCMETDKARCATAHDGERLQPLFSLMSCSVLPELENFLHNGQRKVHDFFMSLQPAICDFSAQASRFKNMNTPEDLDHD